VPTPSEQKALAFVAIVVLLGGAVRAVRAGAPPVSTPLEQQALARQATAAESAAATQKGARKRGVRLARPKRGAGPREIGGVVGVPLGAPVEQGRAPSADGFPPPQPPIDTDVRDNRSVHEKTVHGGAQLSHRIVARRDSFGPFGSMQALRKVKGVGPATIERLTPLVTFSGRPSSPP
jgi:competence protein ComEA